MSLTFFPRRLLLDDRIQKSRNVGNVCRLCLLVGGVQAVSLVGKLCRCWNRLCLHYQGRGGGDHLTTEHHNITTLCGLFSIVYASLVTLWLCITIQPKCNLIFKKALFFRQLTMIIRDGNSKCLQHTVLKPCCRDVPCQKQSWNQRG